MKPEHERVQSLLKDTVTTMCRNSLLYNRGIKVQGLLGITLDDDDIFLIHFNEIFQGYGAQEVSIQQADSVNRGEEQDVGTGGDNDSDSSTEGDIYRTQVEVNPPVCNRKPSRRKAQPWRAVGGLSDPIDSGSNKRVKLDYHIPTDQSQEEEPHSMLVDDDNNNQEIEGYSMCGLVEDCDTGDVDIMKKSYMCGATTRTKSDSADDADTDDQCLLSSNEATQDDSPNTSATSLNMSSGQQESTEAETTDLQFTQGGPFISGIVHNFPEVLGNTDCPQGDGEFSFATEGGAGVSGLSAAGLVHVITGGTEALTWDQHYPPGLAESPVGNTNVKRGFQSCQRPRHNLGSKQQKDALRIHLVLPLIRNFDFNVVPLRVIWRSNEPVVLEHTWSHILERRHECDQAVSRITGVSCFISAITGAFSKPHRGRYQNVAVYPAVSYWIVCDKQAGGVMDVVYMSKAILTQLADRSVTVKPINIPMALNKAVHSQQLNIVDLLSPPLFVVMKDHTNHFTVNKVAHSAQVCGQSDYAVARVIAVDVDKYQDFLQQAVRKLAPTLPGLTLTSMPSDRSGTHSGTVGT